MKILVSNMPADIFIFMYNMPLQIKAYTRVNADGSYTVFINDRHCREAQEHAFKQELKHIYGDDFYSPTTANAIEILRHQESKRGLIK